MSAETRRHVLDVNLPRVVGVGLHGLRQIERLSFLRSRPIAHGAFGNPDLGRKPANIGLVELL
jgi:hypothetical protein